LPTKSGLATLTGMRIACALGGGLPLLGGPRRPQRNRAPRHRAANPRGNEPARRHKSPNSKPFGSDEQIFGEESQIPNGDQTDQETELLKGCCSGLLRLHFRTN
jgi:hypothetical protein